MRIAGRYHSGTVVGEKAAAVLEVELVPEQALKSLLRGAIDAFMQSNTGSAQMVELQVRESATGDVVYRQKWSAHQVEAGRIAIEQDLQTLSLEDFCDKYGIEGFAPPELA